MNRLSTNPLSTNPLSGCDLASAEHQAGGAALLRLSRRSRNLDLTGAPDEEERFPAESSSVSHPTERFANRLQLLLKALPGAKRSSVSPVSAIAQIPFPASPLPREGIDLKEHLVEVEHRLIEQALAEANGVVAHAAKRLNLGRTTLVEKMRKFGISRPDKVSNI